MQSADFELDVVVGCFMFIRREALDEVGLMDERYLVCPAEIDWCD